jgi:hypothetical protein
VGNSRRRRRLVGKIGRVERELRRALRRRWMIGRHFVRNRTRGFYQRFDCVFRDWDCEMLEWRGVCVWTKELVNRAVWKVNSYSHEFAVSASESLEEQNLREICNRGLAHVFDRGQS